MSLVLYGTKLWPECKPAKEFLLKNDIDFKYIDITKNILNLKKFLTLRDNNKAFEIIKDNKNVGVPVLAKDSKEFYFKINKDLIKKIK